MDYLRRRVRELGDGTEERLLVGLDPSDRELYNNALAVSWIDVGGAARIYDTAARILYPDSDEPLVDLGRDMAHADLTGIYKVLLRVATIPMVIERAARLWSTYHKKGDARIEREGNAKRADLIIDGYPELPQAIRVNVSGYVQGVVELTGSKNARVVHTGGRPEAWRWSISWE